MQVIGELENVLWGEMGWRKKELLQVRLQVISAPSWAVGMHIRGGITMLYAHWEGFVKAAGEALVEFVGDQELNLGELAPGYMAIALRKEFALIRDSKSGALFPEVALSKAVADGYKRRAALRPFGSVPTASNLSWKQFSMVASRLEMNVEEFSLLRPLIDERLVGRRNTIAHGDKLMPLDKADFVELHAKVLTLLDGVARQVMRVADEGLYRR